MSKGKKTAIGIIVVLLLAGGAAAAWYFQSGSGGATSQKMTIEDQEGIETESIGSIANCLPYVIEESDDMEFEQEMAAKAYEEGGKLFDMMEDSDAKFFYLKDVGGQSYTDSGDGTLVPEEGELVQTDKEGLAQFIGKESTDDVDEAISYVGNSLEAYLSLDAKKMPDPENGELGTEIFTDKTGNWSHLDRAMKLSYGGENPKKYYQDRDLALVCEDLTAEKFAIMKTGTTTEIESGDAVEVYTYFGVFDAAIQTKSCKGESIYPPEGEIKNVKVMFTTELSPVGDNYEPTCYAIYLK